MKNGGKNKSVVFIICSVCIHTHTHTHTTYAPCPAITDWPDISPSKDWAPWR